MTHLGEGLWIGNSADGWDQRQAGVGAALNVAQDLRGWWGWPETEYAQVGLIDGPGNPPAAYAAAVLTLAGLLARQKTLVYCHTGSRALAVAVMYLQARSPRGWDSWMELLGERVDGVLPATHEAHREAFERMNWQLLAQLMKGG